MVFTKEYCITIFIVNCGSLVLATDEMHWMNEYLEINIKNEDLES